MSDATGDILIFNPATEYQVVEEFEFDELIERPQEVRFFTLTEQTTNFLEKLLPKTGKVSKAALAKAEHEVSSLKKLYSAILKETPTGFEETVLTRPVSLPWVTYSNSGAKSVTPFSWSGWTPLYASDRGLGANYYFQMLDSLPKSSIFFAEGDGHAVYPAIVNGVKALGMYNYTKTAYREDGTFRIQMVPRPDTQDVAKFTGYTIEVPNPAPPNPLEGHPFLGAREAPLTIDTIEDLPTILPSVEAIFEHAVPRTANPYKDALPFMRLYDIKLSQVPWKVWKDSFPPAEMVEEGAPPIEIPIKADAAQAPAKVLTDVYKSPWYVGLSTRKWLSQQLDGGTLVSKILLSQAGNLGPIAVPPPSLLPPAVPIIGTSEDCLPSTITTFEDFASRGIYRTPKCDVCGWYGHGASTCPDRKGPASQEFKVGGGCIPLALISAERDEAPYIGKAPWTPGTDASILQDYQQLISKYTERVVEIVPKVEESTPSIPPSETRELIVSILADKDRTEDDMLTDIRILLDDTEHVITKHTYLDKETSQFLICEHTLDQLAGDFDDDAIRKWSVLYAGYRVCQFCGERIVNVLEAQDEFDEQGRVIQYRSKTTKATFITDDHLSFSASLKKLGTLFNLTAPAEDIFYLLLSLLQVLPEEEQLKPILDFVRSESAKVQSKIEGKKLSAKQTGDINLALSIFGFNGMVILMQTAKPQLLPRRSFGSKPVILRGFPRDTDDSTDAPLIDSLLNVLANTFESYPTTFKGSSVILLRNVLNDRKNVRKVLISSMTKQFVPVFKRELRDASDAHVTVYVLSNAFQPPIVRPARDISYLSPSSQISDVPQTRFKCTNPSPPWLTPSMPFSFRQEELKIIVQLRPSKRAVAVPSAATTILYPDIQMDEIRNRIKRKVPAFKPLSTVLTIDAPEMLRNILLEWMASIAQSKTTPEGVRVYIRTTIPLVENAYLDPSTLRDYIKGILIEFVAQIISDETLTSILERSLTENIAIRSLLTKAEEAKKNVDYLRAREREEFKDRMRRLPDAQREITKVLIDKGLAAYLITKEDREIFSKELQDRMTVEAPPRLEDDDENEDRDVGPQGEVPEVGGVELQDDYGDYGDRRARAADGEEFVDNSAFADEDF